MACLPKLYTEEESGNSYKSERFLALNPRGTIPVLVDGDITLIESAAILTYLAGTFPDPGGHSTPSSYWSTNVVEQAAIIDWLVFAASWIQFGVCTARCMLTLNAPESGLGKEWTPQTLKEAHIRSHKSLEILQAHLEENDWLALGRPTIAETAVFPYIALAHMANIDVNRFPAVVTWLQKVKNLDGFITMKGMDDV